MFSDKTIAIVTLLFVLSMIAERMATFLKLYLPESENQKFRTKQNDKFLEKRRERNILIVALICGFITALAVKANIIEILQSNDGVSTLGWGDKSIVDYSFYEALKLTIGCLLMSFFISVGSKFWHDLLDMLLYSKNLKQKLVDNKLNEVSSIDQLDEYIKYTDSDLIRLAIEQNEQFLKNKFPNINYLIDSINIQNGERKHYLGIFISDSNTEGIPEKIPVKLPSGKIYYVETEITSGLGNTQIQVGITGNLSHEDSTGYTGSVCCLLSDENSNKYLLTNGHVLSEGKLDDSRFNTDGKRVLYEGNFIGTWHYSEMNTNGDFALVLLNENHLEEFRTLSFTPTPYKVLPKDWLNLKVILNGNKSKKKENVFVMGELNNQLKINYRGGQTVTISKAIMLANSNNKTTCKPVSEFGDSGGAVYDNQNNLIGIVTAKDEKFTYVLPINGLIKSLLLKIN